MEAERDLLTAFSSAAASRFFRRRATAGNAKTLHSDNLAAKFHAIIFMFRDQFRHQQAPIDERKHRKRRMPIGLAGLQIIEIHGV